MASFLGRNIERNKDNNTLSMNQTGLIDMILTAMCMENCNLKHTPAEIDFMCQHGSPYCESWDYRSIVGMMMYLVGSTRRILLMQCMSAQDFHITPNIVMRLESNE